MHRNGTTEELASQSSNPQVHQRQVDHARLLTLGRELLIAIGEDPDREAVQDTPKRFANWWREFIEYDPGETGTTFETASSNQMVVVSGLRVWSVCEHHLLPFWCDVSIGYIARDKVLGLSKFARIAHQFAHRPQIQERLVDEIASCVEELTGCPDVAVIASGAHLCMMMRGIKTDGRMTSSVMRGIFFDQHQARQEFLQLVQMAK